MSPLRDALFLARQDVRIMLRAKETLLWAFVMPVLFFYFIGTITGGFGRGEGRPDPIVVEAPAEAGFFAGALAGRLERLGFRVVETAEPAPPGTRGRRLVLPAGMTAAVLGGQAVKLRYDRPAGGLGGDYQQIRVSRAVYGLLADVILASLAGQEVTPESLAEIAARPRKLQLEVRTAGTRVEPPQGFEQAVPGTLVMFTLLVLFTSGGVLLVQERRAGLLRRLASAPMSRGAVVFSKWTARMALGGLQIGFAMLAGSLLFGMDWGPDLPMVAAVLAAYAALCAALAILVGSLARTEGQAVAVSIIASNVLAALGGCWWPVEITPVFLQKLALFLPTGLTMDALHRLVSFGRGPEAVLPHLAILAAAALGAGWLAARRFRFQ